MISRLVKFMTGQLAVLSALSLCLAPFGSSYADQYSQNPAGQNKGACYSDGSLYSDNGSNYNDRFYTSYDDPYSYEGNYDPGSNSSINTGLILGGAILLGAAAGAAAGAAVGGGDRGPPGPSPFDTDFGQTLTFTFTLDVTASSPGSTAIAFVSSPDGTVTESAVIPIDALGIAAIPPIVINNPVFGTYTSGIQILSGAVAVSAGLTETVTASRDGSVTTLINGLPTLGIAGTETQTSADFTYGTLVP